MKKVIISFLVGLNLFGYEINISQSFTKEIIPKELGISLSIIAKGKNLQSVLNKLTDYSDFILSFRNQNIKIKKSKYQIHPKYILQNNKRKRVGYKGVVSFEIDSLDNRKTQILLSQLSAKNSFNDVDILISSQYWKPTKNDISEIKEKLRLSAILWGKKYASKLSETMNENCHVKKINFDNITYPLNYKTCSQKSRRLNSQLPVPIKVKQKYSINVQYTFECNK